MPRVALKRQEYKVGNFSEWLVEKMHTKKLTQTDMGKLLGITQPAFQNRLKKGLFSYSEMLIIFETLEASDTEILNLMKLQRGEK